MFFDSPVIVFVIVIMIVKGCDCDCTFLDECFESCVFLTIFSGERKFYDANLVLEPGQAQVQPGLSLKTFRAPVSFIFIFFLPPCTRLNNIEDEIS